MNKKLFIFILTTFFIGCSSNNTDNNPKDNVVSENKIECNSKCEEMREGTIYPDSLTAIQKGCVEKAYLFATDPKYDSWEVGVWQVEDLMSSEEKEALFELAIWDFKKYKAVDIQVFNRRIKETFECEFDSIYGKVTNNIRVIGFEDPYRACIISREKRLIIDDRNYSIPFNDHKDISSFLPYSRFDNGIISLDDNKRMPCLEHMFHLNNYVFNEANVSRTWLLNYDKYFMSHLLMDFGYDGDNEINKMVLKKNQEKDTDIIDIPLSTFHTCPNGKVKILDNLLKTAAEMSTAECSDHFVWATSVIDSICVYNQMSEIKKQVQENEDNYTKLIKTLTNSQKRELVGHITNYMQPVYEKYLGTDLGYGDVNTDLGDMRILDCFWNYMMDDHEIIAEFEDNNYYGLSDLKSLIDKMKDFKPFYNEENGKFEPWHYTPMRYKNSGEEN